MKRIFPDGKTFLDCTPVYDDPAINATYLQQKDLPGFDLKKFVAEHFELPVPVSQGYSSDSNKSLEENIETLWGYLTRQPDKGGGCRQEHRVPLHLDAAGGGGQRMKRLMVQDEHELRRS